MSDTKLTAHLPGLDIEVSRRSSPDGGAELVTIALHAVPDLASAAARLAPGLTAMLMGPFAPGTSGGSAVLMPMDLWRVWLQATQSAWAPWMALNPWLSAWSPAPQRVDETPRSSPL